MNEVSEGVADARDEIAAEAADFKPDLCDIVLVINTSDNYGGSTQSPTLIATNVPCSYESLGSSEQQVAAKILAGATHRLELPSTAITWAIKPIHRIIVHANDDVAEMTFENPTIEPDSFSPFVRVVAKMSIQ